MESKDIWDYLKILQVTPGLWFWVSEGSMWACTQPSFLLVLCPLSPQATWMGRRLCPLDNPWQVCVGRHDTVCNSKWHESHHDAHHWMADKLHRVCIYGRLCNTTHLYQPQVQVTSYRILKNKRGARTVVSRVKLLLAAPPSRMGFHLICNIS